MNCQSNQKNTAFISMGSNMGDRLNNCRNGIFLLNKVDSVFVENLSNFYLTEPMEFIDQSWFVNAAAQIKTSAGPLQLITILKTVETEMGRVSSEHRYGPRILDFDIIFYDDEIIDTPELVVPHPRMHYREFVLRPLCELCPDKNHPILKKNMKQLLDGIKGSRQRCFKIDKSFRGKKLSYDRHQPLTDQEEASHEILY